MMELENKDKYNQYFTDEMIAEFMASLIEVDREKENFNILDPGAGEGILGIDAIKKVIVDRPNLKKVSITAFELDKRLIPILESKYTDLKMMLALDDIDLDFQVINKDFLKIRPSKIKENYDLVIMNPPYEKIGKGSKEYKEMGEQGYSKTNLYSSFLEKSLDFLKREGQLIAIIPRSFANGTYFESFRMNVFSKTNLCNIHLFESRKLFEDVLQENIIIKLEKSNYNKDFDVVVSHSKDNNILSSSTSITVKNSEILDVKKKYQLRILKNEQDFETMKKVHDLPNKLSDIQIEVSTGPIVDFREGRSLKRKEYELLTVPYLFPEHFNLVKKMIGWPKFPINKENYIINDDSITSKLRENGNYVLVKRFSSKEETRRINASIWLDTFSDDDLIGFDNKINYFHFSKKGLDLSLVKGLCLFLNSTVVDSYFRQVSGNTQVNVSDLRNLRYPSLEQLNLIGNQWTLGEDMVQVTIDILIENIVFSAENGQF